MQMREDYVRDVAGLHTKCFESVDQPAVVMVENLALDSAQPVADSRIHHDCLVAAHYQRAGQVEANSVLLIRWMFASPQLARYDAEHTAAVVAPDAIAQKRDREFAYLK